MANTAPPHDLAVFPSLSRLPVSLHAFYSNDSPSLKKRIMLSVALEQLFTLFPLPGTLSP